MQLEFYQVDAFTNSAFGGNPAAVIVLKSMLEDRVLQHIAFENNLSETAFILRKDDGNYALRWFTPDAEVDLCGHATLASAHVLFEYYNLDTTLSFETKSGILTAEKTGDMIQLNFPARPPQKVDKSLFPGLMSLEPTEIWESRDLMLVYENEIDIISLIPDFVKIKELNHLGVIVTAPGSNSDFVSRFFAPKVGVPEDPVTGSAHSTLVPYWAKRIGKDSLSAIQLSKRKGSLKCELEGDRVMLSGNSVTVIKGYFML
jgi:predicted PhzF superfamily epimerase YddE/YHI9